MKINILDKQVANMIAAGEVVERPASAVKELIENSVDAHAKNVTVEIKNGGMSYIRVTDDGDGIHPDDAVTAFARHATSKIAEAGDLDKIFTLGFRGEALASIAAVARVDMFTKIREEELGVNVVIEGGEVLEKTEVGCPDGTTVIIRDLFFNTPARMKFLKSDAAETTAVTDVVNKMILCHPNVAIKLINNGKPVIASHGTGKLDDCVYAVYGENYSKDMLPVKYNEEHISVTGLTGAFSLTRKDRRHQVFFLNGRNIVNKTISAAVSEAYRNSVMVGRFPVCVLHISITPGLVDVNVHPTKMEVRFSNDKKLYSAVYWAVKEALTAERHIPEVETKLFSSPAFETEERAEAFVQPEMHPVPPRKENPVRDAIRDEIRESIRRGTESNSESYVLPKPNMSVLRQEAEKIPFMREDEKEAAEKPGEKQAVSEKAPEEVFSQGGGFTLVGQAFNTYIIAQSGEELLIVDQHAAHERIWFEELMEQWQNGKISAQSLLIPVTVTLDGEDMQIAEANIAFFGEVGFEIDVFGANSIIVRKVPIEAEDAVIVDTVNEIIRILGANAVKPKHELYESVLHTVACKKALKGGKHLTDGDMQALILRVAELEGINTCPHGRPICVRVSKKALEKQFKRIV